MRRVFLGSMALLMSVHLFAVLALASIRHEGPRDGLRLATTRGALILFGKNSLDMTVYALFTSWSDLEAHLAAESLSLPPLIEVSQLPPAHMSVEAVDRKVLWSRNGADHFVIHTPDSESARVLGNYVYFHGLENSQLGFSLPISQATP